ncbi:AAA domain-containing protein [Pectinatus frisingensis]|uniref:AAA domain-containing protein n=1 Tax=Pectinatus frisingensis TaxID=865 RepID=UPI0018C7779B|nr:AAA domain-containing protein [Pectinatus frisingensis]
MDEQQKEKVIDLFQFIREISLLKTNIIRDIHKQNWHQFFDMIPQDECNIVLNYRDRLEEDENASDVEDDSILSMRKPAFQTCPEPNEVFKDWLEPGWDKFSNHVTVKKKKAFQDDNANTSYENFVDSKLRINLYEVWLKQRNIWATKQKQIHTVRRFFVDMYQLYVDLNRDAETIELMVGNGILMDRQKEIVNHPILLKKVKLQFDPEKNILSICDTNAEPELYTTLLSNIDGINHMVVQKLKEDLHAGDYHPLDRHDAYDFLKIAIRNLCPESLFLYEGETIPIGTEDKLFLSVKPVFFVRKKMDGLDQFIERILENIKRTSYIPTTLINIIGGGTLPLMVEPKEKTLEEELAEIGGEDTDILLTKPANKEQLEIARQIERHDAVLVQGPPGTGKTHTIANLMGHFLATGRSVLVTSYTKKALSVLKGQVPESLQNLCVSVLDDSNNDMEKSVDGITEYLSRYTANELLKKTETAKRSRDEIIHTLAEIRQKIYTIKFSEFKPIAYQGESVSPSEAARFVHENGEKLSYIPGKVTLYHPLPLNFEELSTLYHSNIAISNEEERELDCALPDTEQLLSPERFRQLLASAESQKKEIQRLAGSLDMQCQFDDLDRKLVLISDNTTMVLEKADNDSIQELDIYLNTFEQIKDWMAYVAIDGKRGGGARKKWEILLDSIKRTCAFADKVVEETFGKTVEFSGTYDYHMISSTVGKMKDIFAKNGKIGHLKRMFNKDYDRVDRMVSINAQPISSVEDCLTVLNVIQLAELREQCSNYWNELLEAHDVPGFMSLNNGNEPELVAKRMIQPVTRYLDWYEKELDNLITLMASIGLEKEKVFCHGQFDSEIESIQNILYAVAHVLPYLTKIQAAFLLYSEIKQEISEAERQFDALTGKHSILCNTLQEAFLTQDTTAYAECFSDLNKLYTKYALQIKRKELLQRLYVVAPEWANSISDRIGIHGKDQVPDTIEEAWRWKQYSLILQDLTKEPFEKLQLKSLSLSKNYRKITTELAEYSAWYHLLKRTESNLDVRQALQGWKQTTKKLGKGTGKNAPRLRIEARKLMAQCQNAVPAWIMTINAVMNGLVPGKNLFDVIIIDEASQSDISALPIAYLARKIIVVGDDKQVSPMAVGMNIDKTNALIDMYIKDKIPNWQLYTGTSSLYDIAKTVFQPLMLREHFRCVPDIIGFSNMLSYDYKIKPLRDTSDCKLLPAVVNYRVAGTREQKINRVEAETITSLLVACLDLPEYKGKTFGIISLLGEQQAKYVQKLLFEKLEPVILEKRRILCGDASNFQGDERDIIFLSMVDSNEGDGPLRMTASGTDDSTKKRYNVAASRARDQLWVIHSLDISRDLKQGDIRKTLLDYIINPTALDIAMQKAAKEAESPFEEAVAKSLVAKGYHVVQQWPVGAYRIDMVVIDEQEKIAIECDGECWHSGEEKIRQDMERQTILERLGWRFIRIRGSEYYSNPEETMERIISNLQELGVRPVGHVGTIQPDSTLLQEVKRRATEYVEKWNGKTETMIDLDL